VAVPPQPGEPDDVAVPPQPGESDDVAVPTQPGELDDVARDGTGNTHLDEVAVLYAHVMDGSVPAEEACQADVLLRLKELLQNKSESIKSSSRTAALWLQYMAMIDILRKFMRAERTRNWTLHLEASIWAHSLHKVVYDLCAADVQAPGGTSRCVSEI
jgi:hypothetical protein